MNNILLSMDIQTSIEGKLQNYLNIINKVFEDAASISSEKISPTDFIESISIVCKNSPDRCIKEDGVSGYTVHAGLIDLYVDSDNINEGAIYSTICHEISHAKRFSKLNSYDGRLISGLIFEGIAVAFEDEVRNDKYEESYFLSTIKSRSGTKKLILAVKDDLYKEDYDYMKIFINGDAEKGLPRWAGYEIGYYIVKEYMRITNKKASELVFENVDEIKKAISELLPDIA